MSVLNDPSDTKIVSGNAVYRIDCNPNSGKQWQLIQDITDENQEQQFRPAGSYFTVDYVNREAAASGRSIRKGTLAWGSTSHKDSLPDLKAWWRPSSYTQHQLDYDTLADCQEELTDWYSLPTVGEIEQMAHDSVCYSPIEEPCEPDAPDSWLRLLGYI